MPITHWRSYALFVCERANAPMMMAIAAKMTDAEMQAVADYMQGLR